MKSIGNGWKRAQEAKAKAKKSLNQAQQSTYTQNLAAMSPLMRAFETPLAGGEHAGYVQTGDGKTKPKTLWQRIKRALRSL